MSPEIVQHRILVPAATSRLSELRESLSDICLGHSIAPKVTRRLILAIDEAVANIIEHGQLPDVEDAIELCVEVLDDKIVAEVIDRGVPFDPTPHGSEPDRGSYPRRGFGLYLIHMIVDSMEYSRTEEGLNRLTLTKNLDPSTGQDN